MKVELWLTVSLGTLWEAILQCKATNLLWVKLDNFIVVLAWECSHVISSVAKLNLSLQRSTTVACLLSFQEHIWVIRRSNYTKEYFDKFRLVHKGTAFSKQQPTAGTKRIWQVHSLTLTPQKSWATAVTSVVTILLTLRWRLGCMSRETVRLCHYHYHYQYHPRSNPL